MGVPIRDFVWVHISRVQLRVLNVVLRSHADQLHTPPNRELLDPRRSRVIHHDRVLHLTLQCYRIEACASYAPVELPSVGIARTNQVHHWGSLVQFQLRQHLRQRRLLRLHVLDFDLK